MRSRVYRWAGQGKEQSTEDYASVLEEDTKLKLLKSFSILLDPDCLISSQQLSHRQYLSFGGRPSRAWYPFREKQRFRRGCFV